MAERLLAIQAQDLRGARLAVRARSEGVTSSAVDAALTGRSLLITWLNRGTLHLVCSTDYPWLHALTAPQLVTGTMRRLAQEGVTPAAAERGVATIERCLGDAGVLSRSDLRERLAAKGVPTAGQALVHLLALASHRGLLVRGPIAGSEHRFVDPRAWLRAPGRIDRDAALAELARRYLAGHGPASDRDLARWAGVPLRDARTGLTAIAGSLVQRPDGLVDLSGRPDAAPMPAPRLLGSFEPLLLGWASRTHVLTADDGVVTSNGLFRPVALVQGRAAAVWRIGNDGLELVPLRRISRADRARLVADAAAVTRFLES